MGFSNLKNFRLVDIELTRNKQTAVNMVSNMLSFGVSIIISFFLSPYIVKSLGAEANGYTTLANNFISYAVLLKTALNGVGTRFIIVAYHKGEIEKASRYYSSLFFGDLFLSIIFSIAGFVCVWRLENIINVSDELLTDVKLLFALLFINFIYGTALSVFNSAAMVKNKIFLQSIRDIQGYVIRAALLIVLFSALKPHVFYLGIATLVPTIVASIYNVYYKIKLIPEVVIKKKYFSFSVVKELVSQGMWNSISSLGTMLMTSLDLLLANLLVGKTEMGVLSIAKSMPAILSTLGTTLGSVFFPTLSIDYAKGDMDKFVNTVRQSTRIVGAIVTVPLAFLIAYGSEFYALWQPTLDAKQLQILSVLTIMGLIFYAGTNSVGQIFTVTLHVKERSIAVLISGIVSIGVTYVLVKYTNLGIYAIAGVSPVINTIRMICYTVPYGGKFIGKPKRTFIPVVLRSFTSTAILTAVGYLMKLVIPSDTWITLIVSCAIFAIIGFGINFIIMFNKETRKIAVNYLKTKIGKIIKK